MLAAIVRRVGVLACLAAMAAAVALCAGAEPTANDPAELLSRAAVLMNAPLRPQTACRRFAAEVARAYRKAAAKPGFAPRPWLDVVAWMGPYFEAGPGQQLAGDLYRRLVGRESAIVGLDAEVVGKLAQALRTTGQTDQATALVLGWAKGKEDYGQASGVAMCKIAKEFRADGAAGRSARRRLIDHLSEEFLLDAKKVRAVRPGVWPSLVSSLQGDLTQEDRTQWVLQLRRAFLEPQALAAMDAKQFEYRMLVLFWLGQRGAGGLGDAVAAWLARKPSLASISPQHLCCLAARSLAGMTSKQARAAKKHLLAHIEDRFLTGPEAIRSFGASQWGELASHLGQDVPSTSRPAWIRKLRQAYLSDPGGVASLAGADLDGLVMALDGLGDNEAGRIVLAWLEAKGGNADEKVSMGTLARAVLFVPESQRQATAKLLAQREDLWLRTEGGLHIRQCATHHALCRAWVALGNKLRARQATMRAYQVLVGAEEARAAAPASLVAELAECMDFADMTAKGKGFRGYAKALADLVARDAIPLRWQWYTFRFLAGPLGTDETRKMVEAHLVGADGTPRPAVYRILAFAYAGTDQSKAWQGRLDAETARTKGDTKAWWLLARAKAVAAQSFPASPLRGKVYLDQAMAAATSPECRLAVLRDLVGGYAQIGRYRTSLQILDSLGRQFSQGGQSQEIAALRQELVTAYRQRVAERAQRAKVRDRRQAEALRKLWTDRLARAQAAGDREAVRKYQSELARLAK